MCDCTVKCVGLSYQASALLCIMDNHVNACFAAMHQCKWVFGVYSVKMGASAVWEKDREGRAG